MSNVVEYAFSDVEFDDYYAKRELPKSYAYDHAHRHAIHTMIGNLLDMARAQTKRSAETLATTQKFAKYVGVGSATLASHDAAHDRAVYQLLRAAYEASRYQAAEEH